MNNHAIIEINFMQFWKKMLNNGIVNLSLAVIIQN